MTGRARGGRARGRGRGRGRGGTAASGSTNNAASNTFMLEWSRSVPFYDKTKVGVGRLMPLCLPGLQQWILSEQELASQSGKTGHEKSNLHKAQLPFNAGFHNMYKLDPNIPDPA